MKGLTLEPMKESHLEELARLERLCFSAPWSLESLREELTNPRAVYRVAVSNGELAGYIGMHQVLDEGYINNVAVSPEHRRRGVASTLLEALIAHAREQALHMMTLEVRASNRAAIALYQKYGFLEVGLRKNYYRAPTEDAMLMTRPGPF